LKCPSPWALPCTKYNEFQKVLKEEKQGSQKKTPTRLKRIFSRKKRIKGVVSE
jgi:hypothetical protein